MRFAVSPALGYWTTEIGGPSILLPTAPRLFIDSIFPGLNQVVHIWPYESLTQRLAIRADLGTNAKWNQDYMDVMRPMLASQTNSLLEGKVVQVLLHLFVSAP